jgi:hypothetical protein
VDEPPISLLVRHMATPSTCTICTPSATL